MLVVATLLLIYLAVYRSFTRLLGDEIGTIHSRKELSELLKIHVQHGAIDVETGREVAGAMNYKEHTVREVMTPVKDCFMLSVSEKLNFKVGVGVGVRWSEVARVRGRGDDWRRNTSRCCSSCVACDGTVH